MHSWKDKVTDKLTNLFSDSPSSPTSPNSNKARSHTKEGGYFSSVLTYICPSSDSTPRKNDDNLKPIRSLPTRWKNRDISFEHIPLSTYDDDDDGDESDTYKQNGPRMSSREVSNAKEENGDQGSSESTCSSEVCEETTEPNTRADIDLKIDSFFVSPELFKFLQSSVPNIVKGCQWVLLYSTLRHGISLRTLIRKSSDLPGPCLLITGDTKGAVFGGLLNCPLTPTPKRKYQGTYETFVFTTLYGAPRLFRPTGANRYFYMCLNDLLALGGGGNFALYLDEDLLTGTSGRCDTFGSQCLAHDESFSVKNVELWGFAHSSRYP